MDVGNANRLNVQFLEPVVHFEDHIVIHHIGELLKVSSRGIARFLGF